MKYPNMGSYAHLHYFLNVKILLVSKILSKNGVNSAVSAKFVYQSLNAIRS